MSLASRLTELGLDHRLLWVEVEELLDQAEADVARAIRHHDRDLELNGHVVWTNQRMTLYDTLGKLLDPRRVA